MQITAAISSSIYLEKSQLPLELKRAIIKKYRFELESFMDSNFINLTKTDEYYIILPPNKAYLENICNTLDIKINWVDETVAPKNEIQPKVSLEFRKEPIDQVVMYEQLKGYDFNAILNITTGGGKSTSVIKIANMLNTPMLFVAAQTSFIKNYMKELQKFVENWEEHFVEVNTKWLQNPVIKPYMVCSIQALSNPDILEALYGKVGMLVGDEIHRSITGEKNREVLQGINPKYRVYLSGTYEHRADGFAEAALSANVIKIEGELGFKIQCVGVNMFTEPYAYRGYYNADSFSKKKDIIFEQEHLSKSIAQFCDWCKDRGRASIVYSDNKFLQNAVAEKLKNLFGLTSAILNSDTKKSEVEQILTDYDAGKYDVLIGGAAVATGISLYRASVIIDTAISTKGNTLTQLVGRLKRKNDAICSKSKIYIKLLYKDCTQRNWKDTHKGLSNLDYCTVLGMRDVHTDISDAFTRN